MRTMSFENVGQEAAHRGSVCVSFHALAAKSAVRKGAVEAAPAVHRKRRVFNPIGHDFLFLGYELLLEGQLVVFQVVLGQNDLNIVFIMIMTTLNFILILQRFTPSKEPSIL